MGRRDGRTGGRRVDSTDRIIYWKHHKRARLASHSAHRTSRACPTYAWVGACGPSCFIACAQVTCISPAAVVLRPDGPRLAVGAGPRRLPRPSHVIVDETVLRAHPACAQSARPSLRKEGSAERSAERDVALSYTWRRNKTNR